MTRNFRHDNLLTDERRTVIPVRREAVIFSGWGVKV